MTGEVGARAPGAHAGSAAGERRQGGEAAQPAQLSARHSHALAELAREVAGVGAPAEWGTRAAAAVASVAGWERVYVFRRSETTDALELLASHGISAAQAKKSAVLNPKGLSLTALAVMRRAPVVSGQTAIPPAVAANARAQGFQAFAVLPLIARGRVLGTLTLIDTAPRAVSGEDLAFLQAVADLLATGLASAQLYSAAESARLWLRTIFNQMADGVLVLDQQGAVVDSNAAAARLIGGPIPPGTTAAQRRELFDVRGPDGTPMPAEERPSAAAFATGGTVSNIPMVVVHPDGVQVELSASASPLYDEDGRLAGAVTVLRDVTELRRLERAKDNFLSVASHELRTPLTPLKGLAQILLRHLERVRQGGEIDLARLERYLRTMDGQVDRLSTLVNDLLDVSRIRGGRMELRPETVDLVALTRAVLERFAAIAPVQIVDPAAATPAVAKAHAARANDGPATVERVAASTVAAAEPPEVAPRHLLRFQPRVATLAGWWDPARLEQVITNLVANGIKYSPAGGRIAVTLDRDESASDPVAHLSVHDTGIGIPSEQIEELFQPFSRLRNAPPESFGGLGLGLYISRDIVERHGGRIWAESPGPSYGATFHVTLPLNP